MLKKIKDKLINNLSNKKNGFSFFAGLSLVFAYAPFSQWWLPFVVLPLWLSQIQGQPVKSATKQGAIFAFGWFASGISWVHVAIDQFGGLPLIISLLLMFLLCLYLALYSALACYLSAKLSIDKKFSLWLFPAFWLFSEYLRSVLLTGFPWLSLGYSQIDSPLAVFSPIIGETGITFLILIISMTLVNLVKKNYFKTNLSLLFMIVLSTLFLQNTHWVTPTGKRIKTALVQANIQQSLKWAPDQEWPTMLKYLDLSRINYDAELIIWPESAVTVPEPLAQDFLEMANKSAALNNAAIITGIQNYNFESKKYFNSLIVLGKKHRTDTQGSYTYNHDNRYYKHHLLPIGEFVPFGDLLRPLAPLFNLPMSSFSRGDYIQDNLISQDLHILPLICFEIAFPRQLAANLTNETDILLTVSNDSWFGDSHGPHQHLDMARMRALEFGRPLLRSTNNGITATIDHLGKVTAVIPQFKEAVLKADVQLVHGVTPYSQWGQFIQWLWPLLIFIPYFLFRKRIAPLKL
ncbi:MAG: apolipoprotein N-acyltransferase [Alteromonadaceae bacterium]|jgi:apolipoprotein N-acyltransferase